MIIQALQLAPSVQQCHLLFRSSPGLTGRTGADTTAPVPFSVTVAVRSPRGHENVLRVVVRQSDVADRIPGHHRLFGVCVRHDSCMHQLQANLVFRRISLPSAPSLNITPTSISGGVEQRSLNPRKAAKLRMRIWLSHRRILKMNEFLPQRRRNSGSAEEHHGGPHKMSFRGNCNRWYRCSVAHLGPCLDTRRTRWVHPGPPGGSRDSR